MNDQVIEEIKRLCGKVEWMPGMGYCFMIKDTLCLFFHCKRTNSLRFTMPYLADATDENIERMMELINQANREVKYIKATLLDNGSLTLTYDHKMVSGEKSKDVIPHIIKALDFASSYIRNKIENKK